jgi:ATP-dependent Clp protease protease subunit
VATDMEINLREMLKKDELYIISPLWTNILTKYTRFRSDYWMKADEAKEYGMIDEVLKEDKNIVENQSLSLGTV